jgi:hypothetical protein
LRAYALDHSSAKVQCSAKTTAIEGKHLVQLFTLPDIGMHNLVSPQLRELAERLLADEAAATIPLEADVPVAFRICDKLRRPLTTLAGAAGFHSLLLRALKLAIREAPGLDVLQVNAAGVLEDVKPNRFNTDAEGQALLVAHLVGLLFTFIGETLTLRLMHDVWPNALFISLASEGTEKHEPQG